MEFMKTYKWFIVAAVIVLAALFFWFSNKSSTTKTTAAEKPSSDELKTKALTYSYEIAEETQPTYNNDIKTLLPSKEAFDNKVRAQIGDITNKPEWVEVLKKNLDEHWTRYAGFTLDKAVYEAARFYVGGKYYYKK